MPLIFAIKKNNIMEIPEYKSKIENERNDTKIMDELERLFLLSSPRQLKNSLTEILFSYISNIDPINYSAQMKQSIEDYYFLIKFLEAAESTTLFNLSAQCNNKRSDQQMSSSDQIIERQE
jgi:hypothetical protein